MHQYHILVAFILVSSCLSEAFPNLNPLQRPKPRKEPRDGSAGGNSAHPLAEMALVIKGMTDRCKGNDLKLYQDAKMPFYSCYCTKHNGPIWTIHLLIQDGFKRTDGVERPESWSVPRELQGSRNGRFIESYSGVAFNRGHLVPRGDVMEKGQTDTVVNGVPQAADVNSRYWRCVEHSLRRMASGLRAKLLIITIPVYGPTSQMGMDKADPPRSFWTIEQGMSRAGKGAIQIPIALKKVAYRLVDGSPRGAVCVTAANNGNIHQLQKPFPIVENFKNCLNSAQMKLTGLKDALPRPSNQRSDNLKKNLDSMLNHNDLGQVINEEVPCPSDPSRWLDVL